MHVYALSMYLCWHHHLSMEPCSIGFLLWILFSYFNLWLIVLCARVFDFVSALLIRYLKIVSEYLCCVFLILFPSCLLNFLIIQIFFIYWANWKAYLVGLSILLQFGTGKTHHHAPHEPGNKTCFLCSLQVMSINNCRDLHLILGWTRNFTSSRISISAQFYHYVSLQVQVFLCSFLVVSSYFYHLYKFFIGNFLLSLLGLELGTSHKPTHFTIWVKPHGISMDTNFKPVSPQSKSSKNKRKK